MRFHDPEWLWALAALPAITALAWLGLTKSEKALRMFVSETLARRLVDVDIAGARKRRALVLACAAALMILSLARPQYGIKPVQVKRAGIDIMILLDTSKSMAARDIKPSRMERAKNEIKKLISALEGNRMGLIAFAGASFVECPLTLDAGAVRMFLDSMDVGVIPAPGTNIAAALSDAVKAFSTSDAKTKAVILLTDGESLEGDAESAAKRTADAGLTIFTIGIGSEAGAPIPELDENGEISGYKTDEKGETVLTRLDVETLRRLGDIGGGKFYASRQGTLDLSGLVNALEKMEKTDITSREFSEYKDRYQPLALAALCLLALEYFLSRRSIRRFSPPEAT